MQGFLYPELDRPNGSVQHPSAFPKGGRSIFFRWSGKELWKPVARLRAVKFFEINYIHDYDVIIIGHELARASKVQVLESYHCRRALKFIGGGSILKVRGPRYCDSARENFMPRPLINGKLTWRSRRITGKNSRWQAEQQ